jgi:hypothetical protein
MHLQTGTWAINWKSRRIIVTSRTYKLPSSTTKYRAPLPICTAAK